MKAMLACSTIPKIHEVPIPTIASPKLDGYRCIAINGRAYSRTLKPIPNKYVQAQFKALNLHGFDGELMVPGDFEDVQSVFSSFEHSSEKTFYYNVFDWWPEEWRGFQERLKISLMRVLALPLNDIVRFVPHQFIHSTAQLKEYYEAALAQGHEGLITRHPRGIYKHGRSTLNQAWMLKLKPFKDDEATVVGFEELLHNEDTSTIKKENMVPGETLGALNVRWNDKIFKIGSGFDDEQRKHIWSNKAKYIGKQVTFKYQNLTKYGKPRFPIFKGFRNDE
jgi:DNA ligase 1